MDSFYEIKKIKKFSIQMRKHILDMALTAGSNSSHFGGALSITDIVSALFSSEMNISKENINDINRDRFILSKGHACLAYYSALFEKGIINRELLNSFEKNDSDLSGHPVKNSNLGIDFSNGSLGMGISLGIGVAISGKKRKKNFKVYVVIGDGECNEGSIWEAAMAAPNLKLDNLFVIVDNNNFQQTGKNSEIMNLIDLKLKWESFGWECETIDGHNVEQIFNYFKNSKLNGKPKALIAKTIKGKGFSFSENNNDWHHSILTKSIYDKGKKELEISEYND